MRLVLFACAALLAFAPAAQAECEDIRWETRWQPDPFGTSGGSLIRVPVCQDGAPATKPKTKKRKVTRKQLRALRYRPDGAVSARVRERMVEQLAYGDNAEAIRAMIESATGSASPRRSSARCARTSRAGSRSIPTSARRATRPSRRPRSGSAHGRSR